jgi:predicted AlkP superfamily phosphohydrolase/phosphomutase
MSTGSSSHKYSKKRVEGREPLGSSLKTALATGLAYSIPLSLVLFGSYVYVAGMPVLLRDTLVLQAYLLLASAAALPVLAALLFFPVVGIDAFLWKRKKHVSPVVLFTIVLSVPVCLVVLLGGWILIDRPFDLGSPWLLPGILLFALVGVGLGYSLRETSTKLRRSFKNSGRGRRLRLVLSSLLIPFIVSSIAFFITEMRRGQASAPAATPSALREDTDTRLVVIGLDGATWDIMGRLVEEGKLPHIASLMENGSYGTLESNVSMVKAFKNSASMGMRSPALWESIATGKREREHGIFDFVVTRLPFMRSDVPFILPLVDRVFATIPTTSTMAKAQRVWDILSRSDVDVGVVGWWNLWPVTPVGKGYIVSSAVQLGMEESVFPADILWDYPGNEFFTDEKLVSLFLTPWEGLGRDSLVALVETSDASANYETFKNHYKRDNYMAALSLHLLEERPSSFFATYFWGPDFVCHLFWKYTEPSLFKDVREEDARLFGNIIDAYYIFLDEIVGKHLEAGPSDATYMILSDHGFGPWGEEGGSLEPTGRVYHPTFSGKHKQNGIIVMAGKNVKKGVDLSDAHIFDITPTILALYGLPVGLDMQGRPLTQAIDEEFLARHPVRYVDTYETGERKLPRAIVSKADQEIKERLRALGYI